MTRPDEGVDGSARAATAGLDELVEISVGALLLQRATEAPHRLALVGPSVAGGPEQRLTYHQLLQRARGVAAAILRQVEPRDRVAILSSNAVEWTIAQMGAAIADVVLVALNPALSAPELAHALQHSGARLVLHRREYRGRDVASLLAEASAGPDAPDTWLLEDMETWTGDPDDAPDPRDVDPGSFGMLQYTSGTTGRAKGVMLSHRSMVNNGRIVFETMRVPRASVCLSNNPLFHTGGCVAATLGPLWVGGTLVVVDRFAADRVMDQIASEKPFCLLTVTTILNDLVAYARTTDRDIPRIGAITTGAANVPPALLTDARRLFGASVHNIYGMTEMSSVITVVPPGSSDEDFTTTVGQVLPQTEIKICDVASGAELPIGEVGEVRLRGFGRMLGYLDDDQANQALDPDGWLSTGDLGRVDARGFLKLTGRLKELIIRGGENIAPAEIEACLAEHDDVIEAVVVGQPDDRLGETVAAVLRVRPGCEGTIVDELVRHCGARLARYKIPSRWFVTEAFPLTASSKVQRFRVRDDIQQGALTALDRSASS